MSVQPEESPQPAGAEPPIGPAILGTNALQRDVDSLGQHVSGLSSELTAFITRITSAIRQSGSIIASGHAATAPSSPVTGGSYAQRAPSGQPIRTMGQAVNAVGQRLGQYLGSNGGQGGGGQSSGFGGQSGVNGTRGMLAGLAVTGAFAKLASYAKTQTPNVLTMDKAGFYGVANSGIGVGGYGATAQRAVSAIYGSNNVNLNVTASSVADAQKAASVLNFYSGQTMMDTSGNPNRAWFSAQSGLYAMGYANPYMTQTSIAQSLSSIYSPQSTMTMLGLGYAPGRGAGGALSDPRLIAQNIFARTFQGRSSVSAATMAAATGQGGSLNANLTYLASQAGWAPGTSDMLLTYLKQYNNAINQGANPQQLNTLIDAASRGDRTAQGQLKQYGFGDATVQSIKDLQATKTGRLADQYGDFNSALQQSVSLLTDFNQVLTTILNYSGGNSVLGTAAGYSSTFPGLTGGLGGFFGGMTRGFVNGGGLGGAGGGLGGAGGSGGSGGGGLLTTLAGRAVQGAASGVAMRAGGGILRAGASRLGTLLTRAGPAGSALLSRLGLSGTGALGLLGRGSVVGLGIGVGYAGNKLTQDWTHAGPGSSAGTEWARVGGLTASDAAAGATIGSAVPVLGTGLGALFGGAWGLGYGLGSWLEDWRKQPVTGTPEAAAALLPKPLANPFKSNIYGLGSGSVTATTAVGGAPSGVTPAAGAGAARGNAAQVAVAFAVAQVGKAYGWGKTGPDEYDCSGLTQAAWAAAGVKLPRTSQEQMTIGSPVKPGAEQPGDLMLPEPGHVTMCIGGGKLVEAPHSGANVRVRSYDPKEFPTIRRVVASPGDATGQNAAATGGNTATGASTAPALVGPNGSISELDSLTAALSGALAAPTPTQTSPANPTSAAASAGSANTGALDPKQWTTVKDAYGHTYKVPTGPKPPGTVASWINTALALTGKPVSLASDVNIMVQGESGGDPWSINLTDSNAKAGTPSKGIGQNIDDTFNHNALPGHTDVWNPVDNLISSLRYSDKVYGGIDKIPGVVAVKAGRHYVGYKTGVWSVPEDQTAQVHRGEMVLPEPTAQTVRNAILKESLYSPTAQSQSPPASAKSGATLALNFASGAINVSIPGATAQAASAAAKAFVDAITTDPRLTAMAAGL